jgi:hypothetical protein
MQAAKLGPPKQSFVRLSVSLLHCSSLGPHSCPLLAPDEDGHSWQCQLGSCESITTLTTFFCPDWMVMGSERADSLQRGGNFWVCVRWCTSKMDEGGMAQTLSRLCQRKWWGLGLLAEHAIDRRMPVFCHMRAWSLVQWGSTGSYLYFGTIPTPEPDKLNATRAAIN